MLHVSFPAPSFRIREVSGRDEIYDPVRRRWVALTPEEWVRQNWLAFFIQAKKYPASLIAVERALQVGELSRRFDVVVFDRSGKPWLLLECKAQQELLSQKALQQLLAYQTKLGCSYLLVSNGDSHAGWHIQQGRIVEMQQVPDYEA